VTLRRARAAVCALLLPATLTALAAGLPATVWAVDAQPAGAAPAQPAPSLTDDFSAADQYVESVPTSRGPKVPGVGKHSSRSAKPRRAKLPATVRTQLENEAGGTAVTLKRIATEPDLGAPVENLRPARSQSAPRVPTATVQAVGEGEQDNLLWLLIALSVITALAAGAAGHRYYERRKAAGRG